ncbi:surface-adhesin E family protein [Neisseria lisongii]|uniref:Surface-adhesin protein E-like domain-containing protein n=1 Tax=Neisseria lisongii TaxID=2912188 RepID=A0AAW5AKE6_9NEIS|nr:surface-adhesin E family protein [Neisseria lisongii]MCF7528936.1 hypothetical protein [Neisseria lisongii]
MNKSSIRFAAAAAFALWLAGCAATGSSQWQQIGVLNDNIKIAVDKTSIQKNGALVTFRERKIISNPAKERFVNMPTHKTAFSDWEIHCSNKTYRLTALILQDSHGQTVGNYKFTATAIRPMSVPADTVIAKEYELVCSKAV